MSDGLTHRLSVDRKTRVLVRSRKGNFEVFAYAHEVDRDRGVNTQPVTVSVRAIFLNNPVGQLYNWRRLKKLTKKDRSEPWRNRRSSGTWDFEWID